MWNNRGITLVETLLYIGLSAVVLYTAYSLTHVSRNISKSANTFVGLNAARSQIMQSFKNDIAFKNTVDRNLAVFGCLKNETNCSGAGGSFVLYDSQNTPERVAVVAAPGSSDGIDKNGVRCTGFNQSTGNDSCPYQYTVRWQARCPGGGLSCVNPTVELFATLQAKWKNPQSGEKINTFAFDISYVKANQTATQKGACEKMGGTFHADKTCVMRYKGQECPVEQYLVGFTNEGSLICKRINPVQCPEGQVALGIRNDGVALCGPGCASTGSSSGAIW